MKFFTPKFDGNRWYSFIFGSSGNSVCEFVYIYIYIYDERNQEIVNIDDIEENIDVK
jgi:hypothetical protein